MATSGSKTVAIISTWIHMKFSWWQTSQSIENNTTSIGWQLDLITGNGSLAKRDRRWTVVIDGITYTGLVRVNIAANSTQTLASGTATINHNADGSKTFAYSFTQQFDLTLNNGNYMGTYSGSGSDTLTTIARASQPSLVTYPNTTNNVGDFGETFSIHMNRHSSAFTHTVRYEYGNRSGTIATGVTNGTTWAVPLDFMNDIPNATSASGRIYVDTYNGSTKIGTKYTGFTVTVPASVKPSCSFVLEDVTGIDDIYGSPVKGLSKIKITVRPSLAYSSPIASCTINANGVNYSATEATTGVLQTAGTSKVTATVTDKRGRSGSVSYDMNVQDYTSPKITALAVHRCNADGTANDRGEYVEVLFSGEVSPMSNKNTATYTVRYKKSADGNWTNLTTDVNGWKPADLENNYAVYNFSLIFAADGSSSYDVEVSVADRHGTASRSTSASTAFTLMNYHPAGNALRFGGVAEQENTFQNDLVFRQVGNRYAFEPNDGLGTKGYILLAVITLDNVWADAPIVFQINSRRALCPMNVYVRFASTGSTTDPDLESITYEGDNIGAFLVKAAESTWKLYVDDTIAWSYPVLQDWYTSPHMASRISVEFSNEIVAGTAPSVLGTYYRATPAKMPSILDYVYPVGSIYLSYSHVSPATMFGGTWVRIENAFLWATGASGTIGQTGGEKTHTLTISEMPTHTHMIAVGGGSTDYGENKTVVTGWGKATAGYRDTSTIFNAGSGGAHNNMPPYIQVSVWRRTA